MKWIAAVIIAALACVSATASATEHLGPELQMRDFASTRTFAGRVIKIERDMRGSLNDTFVRGIPDFNRLADRRDGNIADCLSFVADQTTTNRQKVFAVRTLYGLDERGYSELLKGLAKLAQSTTINDRLILTAIRQDGLTDVVIDNYDRPDIRQPLLTLLATPGMSPKGRRWIEEVLSGRFYFRKLGIGSPPALLSPFEPFQVTWTPVHRPVPR